MSGDRLELAVLGPIRASRGGRALPLGGSRQLALLARLLAARGAVVSASQLREDVWPEGTVSDSTLRVAIVRLRQALEDDTGVGPAIVHADPGYAAAPDMFDLDIDHFESLVARGQSDRTVDPRSAALFLRDALALWRGNPFEGLDDRPFLVSVSERLIALRSMALETRFGAEVASGNGPAVVHEIEEAVRADPLSESLVESLLVALYQSGRQVEALAAYRAYEHHLREDLGLRPGPALQHIQHQILEQSDELANERPVVSPGGRSAMTDRLLSLGRLPFVARGDQTAALDSLLHADHPSSTRVACIQGPPGSGKTHLMAVAAERALSAGSAVLYAACGDGPSSGVQFVFDLARGLGIDLHEVSNTISDAQSRAFETRVTVLRRLDAAAAHKSLVIVADDLHWADDETISLLMFVLERSPRRVTWLLGFRSDVSHPPLDRLLEHLAHLGATLDISLEPFDDHDIKALAAALGKDDVDDFDEFIAKVGLQSAGNPLLCIELLRDDRLAEPDRLPDRLSTLIVGRLGTVSDSTRQVCRTLLVAGQELTVPLVAEVCDITVAEVMTAADQLAARGILDRPDSHGLRFRHDLISDVLRANLGDSEALAIRRRLVDVLRSDRASVRLVAEQGLLLPYPSDESERRLIDRATNDALHDLLVAVDYGRALALTNRYLDVVGTERSSPCAMEVLLRIATVLLATADAERGWALHHIVLDRTNVVDNPVLRADAVLATGPSALGGTSAPDQIRQAEQLLELLPFEEHRRRIQLKCWAAHHHLTLGQLDAAMALLAEARQVLAVWPSSSLRGLLLSVRVQATHLVDHPFPSDAFADLRGHASLTGDVVAEAGVALLGLGHAFVEGSIADVDVARKELVDVVQMLPRPDLQWMVRASDAAMHLATGDLEKASDLIDEAGSSGRELRVEMAEPVERLQQSLLMWQRGQLGQIAEMLSEIVRQTEASPLTLALAGQAALQNGGPAEAREMFDRILMFDTPLESSAQAWPAVAALTARLAAQLDHEASAAARQLLAPYLGPRCGTGLAIHGIAYLGTVDLALAFIDAPRGTPEQRRAFTSAAALERERGMTWWADEANDQLRPDSV